MKQIISFHPCVVGNNRLGGQDFNQRLLAFLLTLIEKQHGVRVTDKEDLQTLRLHVEAAKLQLAVSEVAEIKMNLHSLGNKPFREVITRTLFEELNADLFEKVLKPVRKVLEAAHLVRDDVDEIVLVGGSTRIPKVRELIRLFFGKKPNTSVDPELAVVTGVSVQAGIIGGMWPLTVSAVELPTRVTKIHVH